MARPCSRPSTTASREVLPYGRSQASLHQDNPLTGRCRGRPGYDCSQPATSPLPAALTLSSSGRRHIPDDGSENCNSQGLPRVGKPRRWLQRTYQREQKKPGQSSLISLEVIKSAQAGPQRYERQGQRTGCTKRLGQVTHPAERSSSRPGDDGITSQRS